MFGPARTSFILLALVSIITVQSLGISCYGVNGLEYPDQIQCEGSNACCGVGAECLPNRLCKNPTDNDSTFVRGPCLSEPFDERCAKICVYNETIENNYFPRVTRCSDGSMCCSNDPPCCSNKRGRFLDEEGNILASAPVTTSSATSSATASAEPTTSSEATTTTERSSTSLVSAPSSSTTTSAETRPDADADSDSDDGETLALKVGLGIGIPFVAVVAAFATWCFVKRRKDRNRHAADPSMSDTDPIHYHESYSGYGKGPSRYQSPNPHEIHELHERPGKEGWDGLPSELMGSEVQNGPRR